MKESSHAPRKHHVHLPRPALERPHHDVRNAELERYTNSSVRTSSWYLLLSISDLLNPVSRNAEIFQGHAGSRGRPDGRGMGRSACVRHH